MLGRVVKKYREAHGDKGMSQEALAIALGEDPGYQSTVSKWETGRAPVAIEKIPSLLLVLDIPIEELLRAIPEENMRLTMGMLSEALHDENLISNVSVGELLGPDELESDVNRISKRLNQYREALIRERSGSYDSSGGRSISLLVPVVGTVSGDPDTAFVWEELTTEDPLDYSGCRAVRVQGDSMEPVALPGQYAVYRPEDQVRDGNLAIIRLTSGETLFKRVFYEEKGDSLICESVRAGNRPRVIDLDLIEWVHKVIGVRF